MILKDNGTKYHRTVFLTGSPGAEMETRPEKFGPIIVDVSIDQAVEQKIALPLKVIVVPQGSTMRDTAENVLTETSEHFGAYRLLSFHTTHKNSKCYVQACNDFAAESSGCSA